MRSLFLSLFFVASFCFSLTASFVGRMPKRRVRYGCLFSFFFFGRCDPSALCSFSRGVSSQSEATFSCTFASLKQLSLFFRGFVPQMRVFPLAPYNIVDRASPAGLFWQTSPRCQIRCNFTSLFPHSRSFCGVCLLF